MQLQHSRITHFSGLHAKMLLPMQPSMRQVARPAQIAVVATATRREMLEKRHYRVRSKVEGTPERPRLAVFRSSNHIYAQVIDDSEGNTLAAVSTLTPEIRKQLSANNGSNTDAAKLVGAKIAELCKQANIELVCFDRGGFRYHGRVRALADAAREGGLNF